jgi:predicted enzyme related to lactoylglutathione lyase
VSIEVKEIAYICHPVSDVARARDFYEQLLGLKVGIEYEGAPGKWWIEYDVAGIAFAITNHIPPGNKGGASIALEVSDVEAAHEAVRAAGILVTEELTEFPRCRSFAVNDPDGNDIALHQLKPAELVPKFDAGTAQKVAPYCHEPTGRWVGHHQPANADHIHLFSKTGFFIATEKNQ